MEINVIAVQFKKIDGSFQDKNYHYFLHKDSNKVNPGDTFIKPGVDKFGNKKYDTLKVSTTMKVNSFNKLPDEVQQYIKKLLFISGKDGVLYAREIDMKDEWWSLLKSRPSKKLSKEKPVTPFMKRFLQEHPWWSDTVHKIIKK